MTKTDRAINWLLSFFDWGRCWVCHRLFQLDAESGSVPPHPSPNYPCGGLNGMTVWCNPTPRPKRIWRHSK